MASEPMFAVNSGSVGGGGRYGPGAAVSKHRVRFLCRHGGRIIHRPTDGQLKYVGGETRVVAVHRDISFAELMRRLSELFPGEMVLKYQMLLEDLDALVSVRSDDDLKHMIEEHDRYQSKGTSNLHTFLFPAKPIPVESHALEQRYVDAINGMIVCTTSINGVVLYTYPNNNIPMAQEQAAQNGLGRNKFGLSKVQSTPSLCNLGATIHQPVPQYHQSQNQNHPENGSGSGSGNYQFSSQKGGLPPMMSSGGFSGERPEMGKFYVAQGPNYYYPRQYGSGGGGGGGSTDSSYSVTSEMPSRARSPSPRPDNSYGMVQERPNRARSPSPRPDNSYGMVQEMPSRARSPSPRLHSSHSLMPDLPNRGRSPSPKVDGPYGPVQEMPSRGRSAGPRLE